MSEHFYTPDELASDDPYKTPASKFASYTGPPLTDELVHQAETTLGVKLPESLLDLLRESNGGFLKRRHFGQIENGEHVEMSLVTGIGWRHGLDGELGSLYMSAEWEYPEGLLWLDGDGHCGVFLDYRTCGPHGEPSVVWYDTEDDEPYPHQIAPTFETFLSQLRQTDEE